MKATIDKAGRLVIPKLLRDRLGLVPGIVEVEVQGAGLSVLPLTHDTLVREGQFLVIQAKGMSLSDQNVIDLRTADQR